MLGSAGLHRTGRAGPTTRGRCGPVAGTYLVTREPDPLFERAVAAGADVVTVNPHDTDYGLWSSVFATPRATSCRWATRGSRCASEPGPCRWGPAGCRRGD